MEHKVHYQIKFLNAVLSTMPEGEADLDEVLERYNETGEVLELQDIIGEYLKPECLWMTSISIIDAMDAVYEDAKANGNI